MLCLGEDRQESCIVCAEVYRPGEDVFIRCESPGCPGFYCKQCFEELKNLCTICLDPIQYGDLSDIDEEKDSSEDETSSKFQRKSQEKLRQLSKRSNSPDSENDDDENGNPLEQDQKRLLAGYSEVSYEDDSYSDSGNSTEYSYSYQNNKNCELNTALRSQFQDVELQYIPDYVSMNIFHEDYLSEESSRNNVEVEENNSQNITTDNDNESIVGSRTLNTIYSTDISDNTEEFVSVQDSKSSIYYSKHSIKKVKKWLEGKSMCKKKVQNEKFINLLNLRKFDKTISTLDQRNSSSEEDEYSEIKPLLENTTTENTEENYSYVDSSSKKSYYFSNESNTITKSGQSTSRYEKIKTQKEIPILRLKSSSSVSEKETSDISSPTNKMNYLFSNVSYSEESERTNTTFTKSSEKSSTTRRKHTCKTERSEYSNTTICSTPNIEKIKKYRENIHSYYKNIPLQKFDTPKQKTKQNILSKILSRLF